MLCEAENPVAWTWLRYKAEIMTLLVKVVVF
jgi:hypothetical protein